MKIAKLKIKNVRSFKEEVEIKFGPGLNIVIGPNGGGKSNLLDILNITLKQYVFESYVVNTTHDQRTGRFQKKLLRERAFTNLQKDLLSKFSGDSSDSIIELVLLVTEADIENIKSINSLRSEIGGELEEYEHHNTLEFLDYLDRVQLEPGVEISYVITNYNRQALSVGSLEWFMWEYYNWLNMMSFLGRNIDKLHVKPAMLYFSPHRGADKNDFNTILANEGLDTQIFRYENITSEDQASLLKIATSYFANKMVQFKNHPKKGYEELWNNDAEVQLVNRHLMSLGYSWRLKCIDQSNNTYEIRVRSSSHEFSLRQASTGQKEMFNFIFGMFAMNIRHGLILVDEAEIHLHPRWQKELIRLFKSQSAASDCDNQFIVATHSDLFITPDTVSETIRVFKADDGSSQVVMLHDKDLGASRDLLHIVNAHNNQRIFFADKVILVEGLHDRTVYEKLVEEMSSDTSEIIEVIEATSTSYFERYRKFLDAFEIKNYVFADFDHIKQVGNDEVKKLLVTNYKGLDKDKLKSKKSTDAKTLSEMLKTAIEEENLDDLRVFWEYLESAKLQVKEDITAEEQTVLNNNLCQLQTEGKVLLLPNGELEDYLPDEYQKIDKTLEFLNSEDFSNWFGDPDIEQVNILKQMVLFVLDD